MTKREQILQSLSSNFDRKKKITVCGITGYLEVMNVADSLRFYGALEQLTTYRNYDKYLETCTELIIKYFKDEFNSPIFKKEDKDILIKSSHIDFYRLCIEGLQSQTCESDFNYEMCKKEDEFESEVKKN